MSRIFISLSVLPVLLILTTMGVGWWIGDYNEAVGRLRQANVGEVASSSSENSSAANETSETNAIMNFEHARRRFSLHFRLGLATAITTVLINCLSVTYLIGTSRWVREVTEAYGLPVSMLQESTQLKRHTFPWSLAGALAILVIVTLGAASDPATGVPNTKDYVSIHSFAAMLGTSLIVWSILVQAFNLHRNSDVIERTVVEVRRERLARGLGVE